MVFCQLNLIENNKSNIFYKCSQYKKTVPILDTIVNINETKNPFEELDTFLESIIYSNREKEFKKALLKYQKIGFDIRATDDDGDNLLSLLLLSGFFKTYQLNNKTSLLFNMVKIAFQEFNINPFILSGLVCCNAIGYTIFSELIDSYDIGRRQLVCFFSKLKKLFFDYAIQIAKNNQLSTLSESEKFAALLLQLPEYANIKKLYDAGYKIDINLVDDKLKNKRTDIFDYVNIVLLSQLKDPEQKDLIKLLDFIAKFCVYEEHIDQILRNFKNNTYAFIEDIPEKNKNKIIRILEQRKNL
jgi:hypothetical protein